MEYILAKYNDHEAELFTVSSKEEVHAPYDLVLFVDYEHMQVYEASKESLKREAITPPQPSIEEQINVAILEELQ